MRLRSISASSLLYLVLALGMLLRLITFAHDRSFNMDEANLARNIVDKEIPEFFEPLDHEQFAPPFFLIAEKAVVSVFGNSDLALRLIPLIFSLLGLFLMLKVALHFHKNPWFVSIPLAAMSFSGLFLQYATEVKQYGGDVFFTLLLVWCGIKYFPKRKRAFLLWLLLGWVTIGFSMPSVFILATVGGLFAWRFLNRREFGNLGWWLIVCFLWAALFLVYFLLILRPAATSDYLQESHSYFFLPFPFSSLENLQHALDILYQNTAASLRGTTVVVLWAALGIAAGVWSILKGKKETGLLLGMPILLCWITSMLHYYSLMPRLSLFFMPLAVLLISLGIERLASMHPASKYLLAALTIISLASLPGYEYFFRKFEPEEFKPALQFVADHQEAGEPLFVHHEAVPAFMFYTKKYKHRGRFQVQQAHLLEWRDRYEDIALDLEGQRAWLLFGHTPNKVMDQYVNIWRKKGVVVDSLTGRRGGAYLFEF